MNHHNLHLPIQQIPPKNPPKSPSLNSMGYPPNSKKLIVNFRDMEFIANSKSLRLIINFNSLDLVTSFDSLELVTNYNSLESIINSKISYNVAFVELLN
jgi:hypothetical protein